MALRPGSAAAVRLFKLDDVVVWRRTLASHDSCVKGKQGTTPGTKHLVKDDVFMHGALPAAMRSAKQLSHTEVSRVMRWKLARGKMRPLQKAFDENNPEKAVETASRACIKALDRGQWKAALKKMSSLHAVGPATASAVLAAYSPELAPFMADGEHTRNPHHKTWFPGCCVMLPTTT